MIYFHYSDCPTNMYGDRCDQQCNCNSTEECDPQLGCVCKPGLCQSKPMYVVQKKSSSAMVPALVAAMVVLLVLVAVIVFLKRSSFMPQMYMEFIPEDYPKYIMVNVHIIVH